MSHQFEAVTDRLVDVIKDIKIGRRSGLLTARRGEGIVVEEGNLIFANGKVVQANVGRRNGADALNWLSTWGSCRYTFLPTSDDAGKSSPSSDSWRGVSTDALPPQNPLLTPIPDALPGGMRAGVPYPTLSGTEALRHIDTMGLSRSHRRLFLLVDGHRSMEELMQLVRKNPRELQDILRDLERIGVIRRG
jgi:hypothetical protein